MEEKFADLGLQEALRRLYDGTPFKPFVPAAHIAMQEGVDFDLVYFPLRHLGYKAVVEATGELLAGLRHPQALSVVLSVSAKLDFPQISELWEGMVAAEPCAADRKGSVGPADGDPAAGRKREYPVPYPAGV